MTCYDSHNDDTTNDCTGQVTPLSRHCKRWSTGVDFMVATAFAMTFMGMQPWAFLEGGESVNTDLLHLNGSRDESFNPKSKICAISMINVCWFTGC